MTQIKKQTNLTKSNIIISRPNLRFSANGELVTNVTMPKKQSFTTVAMSCELTDSILNCEI